MSKRINKAKKQKEISLFEIFLNNGGNKGNVKDTLNALGNIAKQNKRK